MSARWWTRGVSMNRRTFLRTAGLAGTTGLAGCFLGGDGETPTDRPTDGDPIPAGSTTAPVSTSARSPVPRLDEVSVPFGFDCGGYVIEGTVEIDGVAFVERAGEAVSITSTGPGGGRPGTVVGPYGTNVTDDPIARTVHDRLYRSEIYARDLAVLVGVGEGTYDVRLHFAPIVDRAERPAVFDVAVGGRTVGTGVDLHDWGHDVAVSGPVRNVEVTDGVLDVSTTTREGFSTLSGITIREAGNAPAPPDGPPDGPPTDAITPTPPDPDTPTPTLPPDTPTPGDVPPASLRAYYPLDGTSPRDVVRGLGGSLVGDVSPGVPGKIGSAYAFFRTDPGYVDLPAFDVDGGSASVALWANADEWEGPTGYVQLAFWGDSESRLEFGVETESRKPGFFYFDDEGTHGIFFGEGIDAALPTGEWVHLAGTYNHDDERWTLYVDGDVVASVPVPADLSFTGSATRLADHAEYEQPYQGKLDDVRFYEGVLTEDAVRRLADP